MAGSDNKGNENHIEKAIIPVAGFGTRMYPATRFVPKAFFPVVDKNGVAKPVIMYLLEELDEAGIEEIILIVGREELAQFENIFGKPLSDEHIEKLPERVREYEGLTAKISKKIKYAVQEERKGLGHAVYQAKTYVDDKPVILVLGDMLFRSSSGSSCIGQTLNAHKMSGGQLTVAVKAVELEDVVHYGILTGASDGKMIEVSDMYEKPTIQYAKDFLGTKYKNTVIYYAACGQYVLTPKVFDFLEKDVKNHENESAEIQLTDALCKVLKEDGMTGVCLDGECFDVGIPSAYVETVSKFGK